MRLRLILVSLLIAFCASCVEDADPVVIVRPKGWPRTATEWPHVFPVSPWVPTIY